MIIYSITFAIDDTVEQEWIEWTKNHYIGKIMDIGLFNDYRFSKTHPSTEVETAYNIQFRCASLTHIELFEKQHAPAINERMIEKYRGKFGSFKLVLEEIE
ncbi:MAG: DUF4286 family protein [Flavobacteriales bacterium]